MLIFLDDGLGSTRRDITLNSIEGYMCWFMGELGCFWQQSYQ